MSEKKSRRKATVARIRRARRPAPKKPRQQPSPRTDGEVHPNGVLIGYARVSTLDQNLTLQRDALTGAGCTKLFVETMSGMVLERPVLRDALEFARAGDTCERQRIAELARTTAGTSSPPCASRQASHGRRPLRQRERNSSVKNRMRESCTSGSVRRQRWNPFSCCPQSEIGSEFTRISLVYIFIADFGYALRLGGRERLWHDPRCPR